MIVECFAPRQAEVRGRRAAGPPPDQLTSHAMLAEDFEGCEVLLGREVDKRLDEVGEFSGQDVKDEWCKFKKGSCGWSHPWSECDKIKC